MRRATARRRRERRRRHRRGRLHYKHAVSASLLFGVPGRVLRRLGRIFTRLLGRTVASSLHGGAPAGLVGDLEFLSCTLVVLRAAAAFVLIRVCVSMECFCVREGSCKELGPDAAHRS